MGEIAFEHGAVEYAERRGWLVRKMRYIGRNGCPDRWFFKDGIVVPIEFKGPKGQPSLVQTKERERLGKVGVTVYYVRTIEDLEAALG